MDRTPITVAYCITGWNGQPEGSPNGYPASKVIY